MSLPPHEIPLGAIRFNSQSQRLEYWNGSIWMQINTFSPVLGESGAQGGSSGTRGLILGGYGPGTTDRVEAINIASTGNAVDFCNLNSARRDMGSASSRTRAFGLGGADNDNMIQFVLFASKADGVDFVKHLIGILDKFKLSSFCIKNMKPSWIFII